ncbi:hypothetical protein [Streptomyces sp. NPDC058964]|uniref:hypothetical protein n=1 Tax=Streptomyces sp. NPDC058964 TaxID=3346681 RepID=UPI003698ACA8
MALQENAGSGETGPAEGSDPVDPAGLPGAGASAGRGGAAATDGAVLGPSLCAEVLPGLVVGLGGTVVEAGRRTVSALPVPGVASGWCGTAAGREPEGPDAGPGRTSGFGGTAVEPARPLRVSSRRPGRAAGRGGTAEAFWR